METRVKYIELDKAQHQLFTFGHSSDTEPG